MAKWYEKIASAPIKAFLQVRIGCAAFRDRAKAPSVPKVHQSSVRTRTISSEYHPNACKSWAVDYSIPSGNCRSTKFNHMLAPRCSQSITNEVIPFSGCTGWAGFQNGQTRPSICRFILSGFVVQCHEDVHASKARTVPRHQLRYEPGLREGGDVPRRGDSICPDWSLPP
jgi:hypothetical protein